MSPEEADALINRLNVLTRIGNSIKKSPVDPLHPDYRYKFDIWVGEIITLVKASFKNNPIFVTEVDALSRTISDAAGSWPNETDSASILDKGLGLLRTAKEYVSIDPYSTASEHLKELIEQTLRERYFKSWEVQLLVIVFAFVTTCFFGGTIYLGWQVQSVASQADAARKSIDSARDAVLTTGNEFVARIQRQAIDDSEKELQKLRDINT